MEVFTMLSAKVTIYNPKTGEVVEEYERVLIVGKKPYTDKDFIKVFTAFLSDVLDEEMSKGPIRLLLYILKNMDYNSLEFYLVPYKVSSDLGVHFTTFYNWLKVLLRRGYIERIATNIYRLKPYTAIKGSMDKVIDF
jgi:hypothetical protein